MGAILLLCTEAEHLVSGVPFNRVVITCNYLDRAFLLLPRDDVPIFFPQTVARPTRKTCPEYHRSHFHHSFPKRALVLDYLCQQCYAKTAKAFLTDSMVRDLDADGEEIQSLGTTLAGLSDEGLSQVRLRASAFKVDHRYWH